MTTDERVEVVVLLNSTWPSLRDFNTRWRAVVEAWRGHRRVADLVVVGYPEFGRRAALRPAHALMTETSSWLSGVRSFVLTVPVGGRTTRLDDLGWRRAATALDRALPRTSRRRLVVAATPLWAPLLRHVSADARGFDAVDDWRHHADVQSVLDRVDAGYRSVRSASAVTAVSAPLAERLAADYGLRPRVVPNGVSLSRYAEPGPAPDGLPDRPFAVYVGTVEDRVDIGLMSAAAALVPEIPIVIAGPAGGEARSRLEQSGLRWLGRIPADLVPGLLQRASVALLPHLSTAFSTSMAPMKLIEYLAAGLPVAATPLPSIEEFGAAVRVVTTADELASALRELSVAGPNEEGRRLVQDRDWSVIADDLLAALIPEVHERQGVPG